MRIIGGKYRGRVLATFQGEAIRPTADRVKESLFNILAGELYGARVLDLFCGSGALGIESLSRGAKEAVFNDLSKDSLAVTEKNLQKVGEKAKVMRGDYKSALYALSEPFDIIFLDPPYRFPFAADALALIAQKKLLSLSGVVVSERDRPFALSDIPAAMRLTDERKYGKTYLSFFRYREEEE